MSALRILSWNLFHGRAAPAAGRPLLVEFAQALAGWEWDVALLQEVPPWWPPALARACAATPAARPTSRNEPLAPRRAIASRNPDLLGANGGGANVILVRGDAIAGRRELRLTWRPERRWVHAVRLAGSGAWVACLHATTDPKHRTRRDVRRAAEAALGWARGAPLVLGGDFNLTRPELPPELRIVASSHVDHVAAAGGLRADGAAARLDAGRLSDHRPLSIRLTA